MEWQPKTVAVWQEWTSGPWRAFKKSFDGAWHLADKDGVVFSATSLQEVMAYAEDKQRP
jgi:hypothetical protein